MKTFFSWLKILIGAYAIVFLVIAVCFAEMDATRLIDAAPAYNACDGTFIESFTMTPCEVLCYSLTFSFDSNNITLTPCEVLVYSLPVSFSKTMNATGLIESPPAYNACDGAFIESISMNPCEVLCYSLPFTKEHKVTDIEFIPCEVLIYSEKLGNKRKLGQHRSHAQGRGFAGNAGFQWVRNNNAGMMAP